MKTAFAVTLMVSMVCLSSCHQPGTAGSLDASFGGGDGIVTSDLGTFGAQAYDVALGPDGKIVVAGSCGVWRNSEFMVARFNADGNPDLAFGGGRGFVTLPKGIGEPDNGSGKARSIILQPDGKILAAGNVGHWAIIARFAEDGTLDASFGDGDGMVTTDGPYLSDIALQADGKIIETTGILPVDYPNTDVSLLQGRSITGFGIARYNGDGSPDGSFSKSEMYGPHDADSTEIPLAIAMQTDGSFVIAGIACDTKRNTRSDILLARYKADGDLDTAFGQGGKVIMNLGEAGSVAFALALQTDGEIVVAGNNGTGGDFTLIGFDAKGSLDTSFGSEGIVTAQVGGPNSSATAIGIQSDGKILAAGYSSPATGSDIALVRFGRNGKLDATFGNGGIMTVPLGGLFGRGGALSIQADGRIVTVGSTEMMLYNELAIIRCHGDKTGSKATITAPPVARSSYEEADYSNAQPPAGLSRAGSADFFTDEGIKLYDRKLYLEAAALFRTAILQDAVYLRPHFELARTLAKLMETKELDAAKETELYDELGLCLGLDPARMDKPVGWIAERLKNGTEFAFIKDSPRVKDLLARSIAAAPKGRELLIGNWIAEINEFPLSLNADGSCAFAGGTGTWDLDKDRRLVLSDIPIEASRIDRIELDASLFAMRVYRAGDERPIAVLHKRPSPLYTAIGNQDMPLVAELFSKDDQDIDGAQRAFNSSRSSLVRLSLGRIANIKLGYAPYEYRGLYAGVQKINERFLLQEAALGSRYPLEWYEKLFGIAPGKAIGSAPAFSESRLYLVGQSHETLALWRIAPNYVGVHFLSKGDHLEEFDSLPIGDFKRYAYLNGLEEDFGKILMSMDAEKDWIPHFDRCGLTPSDAIPIPQFPISYNGKTINVQVDKNEGEFMGSSSFTVAEDGHGILYSSGSFDGFVDISGGIVLDGTLYVFYQIGGPLEGVSIGMDGN